MEEARSRGRHEWRAEHTHPVTAVAPFPPPAAAQTHGRSALTRPYRPSLPTEVRIGSNLPGSNPMAAPSAMKIPDSSSCFSPPPSPSSRVPALPFSPSPWRRSGGVESGEAERGKGARGRRRRMGTHSADASASPLLKAYFRVADAWARTILSNTLTVAHGIRGKKVARKSTHPTYLLRLPRRAPPGVLPPKFRIPRNPGSSTTDHAKDSMSRITLDG